MRAKRFTAEGSADGVPAGTGSPGVEPGPGGPPAPAYLDEDVRAIRELLARIRSLWDGLTALAREDLTARLELLSDAVDRRDTDSRAVRAALQQVLLNVGTGALTTLSDGARQRLAALTGISLPGGAGCGEGRAAGPLDAGAGERAAPRLGGDRSSGPVVPVSRLPSRGLAVWSGGEAATGNQ